MRNKRRTLIWKAAKELYLRFRRHGISGAAGQIAYFFILSVFPFFIFVNAIIASFDIPSSAAVYFLEPLFPEQIVTFISQYLQYINSQNSTTFFSFGVVIALFSSSKSVRALMRAFDLAYGIRKRCGLLRQILFSMLFMFFSAIIFIICAVIVALGNSLVSAIIADMPYRFDFRALFLFWRWMTMAIIMFGILIAAYKIIPSENVKLSTVFPGVLFALVGFLALTAGFSLYVNHIASYSAFYGTIGAVLLLMLWMYFAGIILLLGAELNKIVLDLKNID